MSLSTTFTLNKAYYQECFDESLPFSKTAKPKYQLLVLLITLGLIAFYILQSHYLGVFMFMLAVVECLAYYYKRPWWIARQMLTRASGSEVELTVSNTDIIATNPYKSYQYQWQELEKIIETPRGFLLKNKWGMQYVSKTALSEDMQTLIREKIS